MNERNGNGINNPNVMPQNSNPFGVPLTGDQAPMENIPTNNQSIIENNINQTFNNQMENTNMVNNEPNISQSFLPETPKDNGNDFFIFEPLEQPEMVNQNNEINNQFDGMDNQFINETMVSQPEPVNPVPTIEPMINQEPIEAVNPVPTVEPMINQTPMEPVNPVPTVEPMINQTPMEPVNPAPTIEPMINQTPMEPVNPVPTIEPMINQTPMEPVNPVPTVEPMINQESMEPVNPVSTVEPMINQEPMETVNPVPTIDPMINQEPIEPVNPVPTVKPIPPVEPMEPNFNNSTMEAIELTDEKEEKPKNNKPKKEKKGGSKGLIFFLILIIIGLGGYILYDKYLVNYLNPKENTKEEETEKTVPLTNDNQTLYFISANQKNSLMLGKAIGQFKNFVLVVEQNQVNQYMTGYYDIANGKITLKILTGCTDQLGNFTCQLPQGVEAIKGQDGLYSITLDYNDEKMLLGNIELINNIEKDQIIKCRP